MRDDNANHGEESRSVTLNITLSNDQLTVLVVLGGSLDEGTDLVLVGCARGHTCHGPLIDSSDLLVELGAVLSPIPA